MADEGASVIPVHTVMEVYRVAAGMPLVRVLPSARDEVNAASFHPFKVCGHVSDRPLPCFTSDVAALCLGLPRTSAGHSRPDSLLQQHVDATACWRPQNSDNVIQKHCIASHL